MFDKQRVRPILLAGAIAGFGGLALIGGTQPAAAQYNPYCSYPNYDPYYCQVYGSYAYDYPLTIMATTTPMAAVSLSDLAAAIASMAGSGAAASAAAISTPAEAAACMPALAPAAWAADTAVVAGMAVVAVTAAEVAATTDRGPRAATRRPARSAKNFARLLDGRQPRTDLSTNREHRDRGETLRVAGFAYVERVVASVFQLPEQENDRPFRRPTTRTIRGPRRSIAGRALLSGCSAADMPLLFLAVFSAKTMLFQEVRCFSGDFSAGNSGGAMVRPLSALSA